MTVTQGVITDLLPAYLSGEARADTQAPVDEFLRGRRRDDVSRSAATAC
jgi:hypothetical protein